MGDKVNTHNQKTEAHQIYKQQKEKTNKLNIRD